MSETPDTNNAAEEVSPAEGQVLPMRRSRRKTKAVETPPVEEADVEEEATPPSYALSEEEGRQLREIGGALVPVGFDIDTAFTNATTTLLNLPTCFDLHPATREQHNRPSIDTEWSTHDQVEIAQALLIVENTRKFAAGGFQPNVVYRGMTKGELQTVVRDGGGFSSDVWTKTDMVSALEGAACWLKHRKDRTVHAEPRASVKAQVSTRHMPYPTLKAVVNAPRYSITPGREITVATTVGYDPATATFVGRDFEIKRKAKPTDADVAKALGVITDLIGEFPFADEASRRNAYAFALTLPLRDIFTTAPGFVIAAEDPESGKTLLVQTIAATCFGVIPTPSKMAYKEGDQERRNISAILRDAPAGMDMTWFDEPRNSTDQGEMQSSVLNLILTAAAGFYTDRPVFQKEAISINVQRTFVMTGNNLFLNSELRRRSVRVDLVKQGGNFTRTEEELMEHAIQQQGAFHQAVATLIDNWIAKGRPEPKYAFPSYNTWLDIVGGILEAAGIVGLRENPETAAPYSAAKADLLFWIHDNVTFTETDGLRNFKAADIETAMRDSANRERVLGLVEEALFRAPAKEENRWDTLYDLVSTGSKLTITLSKVMGLCLSMQTNTTLDGRDIRGKRLAKGSGSGVRYRLTTNVVKRLDRRTRRH